ncbi:hypothetical protein MKW98_025054, partial [Papaver atlanticum]
KRRILHRCTTTTTTVSAELSNTVQTKVEISQDTAQPLQVFGSSLGLLLAGCVRSAMGSRCVICGGVGISDAYYCKECTQQEKDRDGCPKIVNLGSAKTDLFYERKKYGFKKR